MSDLFEILRTKSLTITTAESCTGGLVAAAITDIPGASAVFDRGVVTYSNEAKQELLGVPTDIIQDYGAVSPQCAAAMAEGALKNSHADIAISVTGIAGPDGSTAEKPVGLVYIGIATKKGTNVTQHNFEGARNDVRSSTVTKALNLLTDAALAI